MPVPNFIPSRIPLVDNTDINNAGGSGTQDLTYKDFGTKNSYYEFLGEQDGMQGAGPNPVQVGDEEFQPNYDEGWRYGQYFRTMAGMNGFTI